MKQEQIQSESKVTEKKQYQKPTLKPLGNVEQIARDLRDGVLAASNCW